MADGATMTMDRAADTAARPAPRGTAAPGGNRRVALVSMYGIENRGVRYISAVLRRHGFEPHLVLFKRWVNNQIAPPTGREERLLADLVREIDPLVTGIGFGAPYLGIVTRLTSLLRAETASPVLWGGVHPTVCPEDGAGAADFVCVGEGEYPTLDLARALAAGDPAHGIPNLRSWPGGVETANEVRPLIEDLDSLPFPDYLLPGTFFVEDNRVRETDPIAGTVEYRIYPTRGCPYSCAYCHNSVLRGIFRGKGRYYRQRGVESVVAELERARGLFPRLKRVKFDGDVFAFPPAWREEFCREYGRRVGLPFEILTYPDELTEEDLRRLKGAGMVKLQAGIQSGSDAEVREAYGRGSTAQDIRDLTARARRAGVEVVYDVIFDNPLAGEEDKRAMVELLLDLPRPFHLYLYSLTVFPKTALAKELLEKGLITPEDVEGRATKSFRQFRLSLDWPRPPADVFWICLTILSSKSFVPRRLVRLLMRSSFLRRHPAPLVLLARLADLVKVAGLALAMLRRGELTLFKIRQYGSLRRMISQ